MSNHDRGGSVAFRSQDIGEIADELPLEDVELAKALVALRLPSGDGLRQRVRELTAADQAEIAEARRGRKPPSWRRFVLRAGVVVALLLSAATLLIASVPSVRAAFGRFMQQRFGLVLIEPIQEAAPTAAPTEDVEVLAQEVFVFPTSFEDAQAQVSFTIPMPAIFPEGFELRSAWVGSGPHGESLDEEGNRVSPEAPVQVILAFRPDEESKSRYHPEAILSLNIMDQVGIEGGYAVPVGSEEEVEVDGNSAVFVRGAWVKLDESRPPSPDNVAWDDAYDAAMLSWEANGFTYTLSGSQLRLLLEDYLRIAESVR